MKSAGKKTNVIRGDWKQKNGRKGAREGHHGISKGTAQKASGCEKHDSSLDDPSDSWGLLSPQVFALVLVIFCGLSRE